MRIIIATLVCFLSLSAYAGESTSAEAIDFLIQRLSLGEGDTKVSTYQCTVLFTVEDNYLQITISQTSIFGKAATFRIWNGKDIVGDSLTRVSIYDTETKFRVKTYHRTTSALREPINSEFQVSIDAHTSYTITNNRKTVTCPVP